MNKFFDNLYRKMIFLGGDIRKLNTFPWVTWSEHKYEITYEEILNTLPLIRYGDIGLHRHKGYLSNVAIPGFMKHAWIHTNDGIKDAAIVEAISEGVVKRHAVYPMFSDYTIILRPNNVTVQELKGACIKANKIVGCKYDHNFKFDIEEELAYYTGKDLEIAKLHLEQGQEYIDEYDHAFSCTEVVGFSWWHKKEQLKIERTKARGKSVIKPDTYLNDGWSIVWMSKSVTVDIVRNLGLHPRGVEMIQQYLASKQLKS